MFLDGSLVLDALTAAAAASAASPASGRAATANEQRENATVSSSILVDGGDAGVAFLVADI